MIDLRRLRMNLKLGRRKQKEPEPIWEIRKQEVLEEQSP